MTCPDKSRDASCFTSSEKPKGAVLNRSGAAQTSGGASRRRHDTLAVGVGPNGQALRGDPATARHGDTGQDHGHLSKIVSDPEGAITSHSVGVPINVAAPPLRSYTTISARMDASPG